MIYAAQAEAARPTPAPGADQRPKRLAHFTQRRYHTHIVFYSKEPAFDSKADACDAAHLNWHRIGLMGVGSLTSLILIPQLDSQALLVPHKTFRRRKRNSSRGAVPKIKQ